MGFNDGALLVATILGPILAVQAQKFLERATERRRNKILIFRILMTTRATRLSTDHVRALNSIDLDFGPGRFGFQSNSDKRVVLAWKELLDEFSNSPPEGAPPEHFATWIQRRDEAFLDLIFEMSRAVGYNFDKVYLRRSIYHPRGHAEIEETQSRIQVALKRILEGEAPLPMNVVGFPTDPEAAEAIKKLYIALLSAVSESGEIAVRIKNHDS